MSALELVMMKRVGELNAEVKQLQADNERLRQAVTYLCSTMEVNGIHDNGDIGMHDRAIALGRAALKEGHNK